MELYELNWILPNIYLCHKSDLEMMRFLAYVIAQTQSTKELKITDIMKFEWDEKTETSMPSKSDIKALKDKVNKRLNELNCNG